jgi:hypothetical protein
MRLRFSLLAGALAAGTATAQAQPAQQIVDRIGHTVERVVDRRLRRADRTVPQRTRGAADRSRRTASPGGSRSDATGVQHRQRRGNIVVTGGSGDEVSIDAVKRTRGSSAELASVRID